MLSSLQVLARHGRNLARRRIYRHYSNITEQEPADSLYDALSGKIVMNAFQVMDGIPGKGRALVASTSLEPGDLILATDSIAAVFGEADNMPAPDLLVDLLQTSQFSGDDIDMLRGMHGAGAGDSLNFKDIVSFNAFGDEFEDLAMAEVSGLPARSFVGLWPGFSYINHSCVPNCIHYASNGIVRVRAARPIAAGEELTISYLGREDFSPLDERRKVIQERYKFKCGCARCRMEAALPVALRRKLTDVFFDLTYHLSPSFNEVVSNPKPESLKRINEQVAKHHEQIFDLLAAPDVADSLPLAINDKAKTSVAETPVELTPHLVSSAAVYELFEMQYLLHELQGEPSREQLMACWEVNRRVGPGSELQVFQACRLLRDSLRDEKETSSLSGKGDDKKQVPEVISDEREGVSKVAAATASDTRVKSGASTGNGSRVMQDAEALRNAILVRYGALSHSHLAKFTRLVSKLGASFV